MSFLMLIKEGLMLPIASLRIETSLFKSVPVVIPPRTVRFGSISLNFVRAGFTSSSKA